MADTKVEDDAGDIRIFLSYSHKDKSLLGELRKKLESNGFEIFMAHEDIEPSKEWEEEIIRNLLECDIFIPIISNNFKESKWTDQETGIAFAEDKLIIPIDIELVPYGFIGKYQALKYDEKISHTYEGIMDIIGKSPIYDKVKDFFIKRFVESKHYVEANERIEELKLVDSFTDDQINEIIRGYVNNLGIRARRRGGFKSGPFVHSLFRKYSDVIDPGLKEKYEAYHAREKPRDRLLRIQIGRVWNRIQEIAGPANETVNEEEIFEYLLAQYRMRRTEASEHIGILMEDGLIYSPSPGYYKKVEKKK